MTLKHSLCRPPDLGAALPLENPLLGSTVAFIRVHDGKRVVDPGLKTRLELEEGGHQMRFGQIAHGNSREFRQMSSNETALGVLIEELLLRRIDSNRVDSGHTRLHLDLAVVDSGLEVHKMTSQENGGLFPVKPKLVGGETEQHRAHPEVDPAVLVQGSHAGIDHREAGFAFAPGLELGVVELTLSHSVELTIHVVELHRRLRLEFLDEVTVPPQSALELLEGTQPLTGPGNCMK